MTKSVGKQAASKAAKVLSNPNAGARAKSAAARTLALRAGSIRVVQSLPVKGKIPRAKIREAVEAVARR